MSECSNGNERKADLALSDIVYEKRGGIAKITINRPEALNAVRKKTADEMVWALQDAGEDDSIGVVIITGTGNKAFCSGGGVK